MRGIERHSVEKNINATNRIPSEIHLPNWVEASTRFSPEIVVDGLITITSIEPAKLAICTSLT